MKGLARWLRIAAAAAGATALCWQIFSVNLTTHAILHNDERLARFSSAYSADAATWTATRQLLQGEGAAAEELAAAALRRSPLDPRAMSVLALAWEGGGRIEAAAELMMLAGESGWRSPLAQLWLLETAIAGNAHAVAAQRGDALLRQALFQEQVLQAVRRLVESAEGRDALAARLADAPPWRRSFLTGIEALSVEDLRNQQALLFALQEHGAAPDASEIGALVSRLAALEQYGTARWTWWSLSGEHAAESLLSDGGFERLDARRSGTAPASPFEWRTPSVLGATARADQPPIALAGPALHVRAEGSAAGTLLEQTLVLPSGRYRFSVAVLDGSDSERDALRWRMACVNGEEVEMRSGDAARQQGWMRFHATFSVPMGCDVQRLGLRALGRSLSAVDIWYDELVIAPQ